MSIALPFSNRRAQPQPGEPEWWLMVLEMRLRQRQASMQQLDNYYGGNHPLPFLTKAHEAKMRDEFSRLLQESRSNFMRLVVDATEERLRVEGFRLSATQDPTADTDTWDIWQANQLDAQAPTAFLEALVKGVSYLSVWLDDDDDGYADIAVEDPTQTIVAYRGGTNYRVRDAALKIWLDEFTGMRRANVYLPDGIYKFQAPSNTQPVTIASREQQEQIPWAAIEEGFVANPLAVVPIIPLRNRPRLLVEGESEIADSTSVQNQINAFLFLLALAGYFGAHRQRFATGMTIHEDEKSGRPVEPFNVAVDRLWTSENPNAKFGEFSQTDLTGYIKAIEQKIEHIAVTTRTPRHYLIEQGQSPSGDAIVSAEAGLVMKVERRQTWFGEGLEEALRLARRFQGSPDSPPDSEIVWADPRNHSPGVIADSVAKQYLAQMIPLTVALQELGYSQVQINQILDAKKNTPELFAPDASNNPIVASAQRSDVIRNTPRGP